MKKIALVLMIALILMTGCSVKEGFTTFGALTNKVDQYLINLDVSDADKIMLNIASSEHGDGSLVAYKNNDVLVYLKAELTIDDLEKSIEVFYIDESLTYIVLLETKYDQKTVVTENLIEYIVMDGKLAVFNTEDSVLEDIEDSEKLTELIVFLESQV